MLKNTTSIHKTLVNRGPNSRFIFEAILFIYLFIGRESKWTYMTDGVKRNERSMLCWESICFTWGQTQVGPLCLTSIRMADLLSFLVFSPLQKAYKKWIRKEILCTILFRRNFPKKFLSNLKVQIYKLISSRENNQQAEKENTSAVEQGCHANLTTTHHHHLFFWCCFFIFRHFGFGLIPCLSI